MSSSMLEQAVIDAQALKEAAIKNAEQEVLEKYSGEIKEAVDLLIEQSLEEPNPLGSEDSLDLSADLGDAVPDAIVADIPMKATEQVDGAKADDTVILDLDALMETVKSFTESESEEVVFEVNESDLESLMQEESESIVEFTDKQMDRLSGVERDWEGKLIRKDKKENIDEELDLDEESLKAAIAEILKVDLENVPRGMAGTTHPTTIEQVDAINIAAAAEEDTVKKEENEAFNNAVKKIANLEEQVKSLKSDKNRLAKDHNELKSIARQVSGKLTELNTANAKLVYQNRILESSSLNERQKTKLVEAVSNANSNEEAKVIFETLQDSLSSKAQNAPSTLSEAVNKNSWLILKSNKKDSQVSDSASERMKKLAGII